MTPNKSLIQSSYDVIELTSKSGKTYHYPKLFLAAALPDTQTAMFFIKGYDLTMGSASQLLLSAVPGPVTQAILAEAGWHSQDLQDYLLDYVDGDEWGGQIYEELVHDPERPLQVELLPEVWKSLELEVAKSVSDVAAKLGDTVAHMPGRTGEMVFKSLAMVNAQRPTIGKYKATITHQQVQRVLIVFDVSGSMSEQTVRTICDDVVGLAFEANAALAIVSNHCFYWEPGGYDTNGVLDVAEYGGTHYEELAPLFTDREWDVVVCVADYDSSPAAERVLSQCNGKIGELLDISLVHRSTFLAQCLGHLADSVRPLLIAAPSAYLCN